MPKSNFPNFRALGFSIVIHNVIPSSKEVMERFCADQSPLWSIVSHEPYPSGPGHHLHIYIRFKHQRSSLKWFNFHSNHRTKLIDPEDGAAEGEWGRIQVDPLKGSKDDCLKYLTDPKKDKPVDPDCKLVDHEKEALLDLWAESTAYLTRKFIFPQMGPEPVRVIAFCEWCEANSHPIPALYSYHWNIFKHSYF